jgi:hypothetical protein
MTSIIPRHHYCSLHSADQEHFMYDQYGYERFTVGMDTTELNNATGISVENYTPAATNFGGAHRFSLKQASDWYYKLKGWRFDGDNNYFDYRSFDTRLAFLQSGMWVNSGLRSTTVYGPTIGSGLAPLAGNGFWGKHLAFFHQKYQSNGVYDYCPYFLSYGAFDRNRNLLYRKQMNHPSYLYDPGNQIIAQGYLGGTASGTATTTYKEWETFPEGGGFVRTTQTTKDFVSVRPDIMYQFTKSSNYDLYEYIVAYGSGQVLHTNAPLDNGDLARGNYTTDPLTFEQQKLSAISAASYHVPISYFDNLDLYNGITVEARLVQAALTKQIFIETGGGDPRGPLLGITNMTSVLVPGYSTQETYHGVPVWKHWTGNADPNVLRPIFDA